MQTRKEKITEINRILREWGGTNVGELECDSPVYNSMGKNNFALVERFNVDDVDINHYVHDTFVDDFSVPYEDLPDSTLDDVFAIIEEYAVDMERTFNRCKDNNY